MVFPFLVLYLHRSLRLDLELATSIAACWGFGSFLAGPLGGWAADRFDCVKLLAFTLIATGCLMLLYPQIQSPIVLVAATFGLALVADIARPSTMTALARLGGEHGRDAFALNYLAINVGMSIGPTLGGFLAEIDYRWLFWVDGSTSFLAGCLLLGSGIRCPPQPVRLSVSDWNVGRQAFRLLFWLSLTYWVFMSFFAASPLYAVQELHLRERDCGLIWLINTVIIVLTSMAVTRVTQGYRLPLLLACACLGLAACYATLSLLPSLAGLILATLFLTLGEMMLFSNANEYLARVVPTNKVGRAMGFNAMSVSLALTFASPTVGYFFANRSPHQLWVTLCLMALVAAWGFQRLPEARARQAT